MAGRLKYDPRLAKRLITEYLTQSRVVTEKPCYLFSSLVVPHPSSQDCQARLRNGETVNADILLNLKTQWEQPTHDYSPPMYFNRGLYVELVGEILKVLDDFGDTNNIANWVQVEDGLAPVDETTIVKEGSHSAKLGIDADLNVADRAYWLNSVSMGDWSEYQHDWLYVWVYFSSIDYLATPGAAFEVWWGSDPAKRGLTNWTKLELSVGWNLLKCDLDNPDWSTGIIDWTNMDYNILMVREKAGNDTDFVLYADSMMLVRPFSGATDGITKGATVQYLIE